ncbi:MAG: hypothetical protein JSS49_13735 [Planctomycetes bacterium]|nr:hypothetical protein [Planctomycetota bacterium]
MRTIRRIWWSVMGALFVAWFVAVPNRVEIVAGPAFAGMIIWFFLGTFFSRIIGSMIVSSIRCQGCGLEIPAVTRWRVGSFTDHRDRHFLLAKNPVDGARLGHIDCPQCSCTIIL